MRKLTKRLGIISAVVAVGTGGSIAWAAWTANGSGSAAAKAGVVVTNGVTAATATVTGDLYPGVNGTLVLTVTNQNKFKIAVDAIAIDTAEAATWSVTGANDANTCTSAQVKTDITLLAGAVDAWKVLSSGGVVNNIVPGKTGDVNGTRTFTIPGAVALDNDSPTGCQNMEVTIPVTLTAASVL